jgi:hypothetical protein
MEGHRRSKRQCEHRNTDLVSSAAVSTGMANRSGAPSHPRYSIPIANRTANAGGANALGRR